MLTLHSANAFRRISDHAPYQDQRHHARYIPADLGNFAEARSVKRGAAIIIDLATLAGDGLSGGVFGEDGAVP